MAQPAQSASCDAWNVKLAGSESRRGWNEIEPTTREFLQEHAFTEADWELIRRGEMIADDGRSYLAPESVNSLPDQAIADHLKATGRASTERHVAAGARIPPTHFRDDDRLRVPPLTEPSRGAHGDHGRNPGGNLVG